MPSRAMPPVRSEQGALQFLRTYSTTPVFVLPPLGGAFLWTARGPVEPYEFWSQIVQRFATLVGVILAAVLPVNAVQSQSPSQEVMTLLRYEKLLDGVCRSHIPDSPHAHDRRAAACCGRTLINVRLNQLGWCYGKRGQTGADQRWHRCTRESHRNHPSNYCS
jgi:hypothetical protein